MYVHSVDALELEVDAVPRFSVNSFPDGLTNARIVELLLNLPLPCCKDIWHVNLVNGSATNVDFIEDGEPTLIDYDGQESVFHVFLRISWMCGEASKYL